jgi:hypothetical protein
LFANAGMNQVIDSFSSGYFFGRLSNWLILKLFL